jgi:two-component system, chemotaxis family, chemotaxis protein CheY
MLRNPLAAVDVSRVRALILDDSRAMRMILSRIMHSAGFDVVEGADGQAGLDALSSGPLPDVALVDWNMPGIDGLSFVHAVRDNPAYRSMTLMMVTTESEHDQVVRALAAGAHEYIIKPFTADAVIDKLDLLGLLPE